MAVFTTCHARLKLYSYLKKLGDQVLYYDTDSVIYKWKEGQSSELFQKYLVSTYQLKVYSHVLIVKGLHDVEDD